MCQWAAPAEPGRTTRSSRPAARVPRTKTRAVWRNGALRDGSRFPFDHIPGIIPTWTGRAAAISFAANRSVAAVPDLWPGWALHRSVSTRATTKVSPDHDLSGNPRGDSPLFLRRTLEDRHDCPRTERPSRCRAQRHRERAVQKHAAASGLHRRSLYRVHSRHAGTASALACHAYLRDGARP